VVVGRRKMETHGEECSVGEVEFEYAGMRGGVAWGLWDGCRVRMLQPRAEETVMRFAKGCLSGI
jgi:hypothetical protein